MSIMRELLDTAVGETFDTWCNIGQLNNGWVDHMALNGSLEAGDLSNQYDGQEAGLANKRPAPSNTFKFSA